MPANSTDEKDGFIVSVYATGDTHGDFQRLLTDELSRLEGLTREDCLIICGDFGGVWCGEPEDAARLDPLESLPYTILWVDGNHENFDELYRWPVEEWHGGKIHRIRSNVLHLMRGQLFEIEGRTFFTMGGARSVDVWDGILDPEAPDFAERFLELRRRDAVFRIKHLSWWEQELPSAAEYAEARRTLERAGHRVDYIVTHCAPDSLLSEIKDGQYLHDAQTEFLEEVRRTTAFRYWLFGHYHANRRLRDRFILLYNKTIRVL